MDVQLAEKEIDKLIRHEEVMVDVKTLADVRRSFIEYFSGKGHAAVASAPLLAHNDETLLFVNSGMVQFKDTFAGTEKRDYSTAVSCQKCLRVSGKHNDLDDVGRTRRHHTFFEMLGNFSFGDYFKKDAIIYGWEFVTQVLKLDKSMLWVTVHENDAEAEKLWRELTDVKPERIVKLGDKTNLWTMGDVGPWGYCSEIFHYMGDAPDAQSLEEFLEDDGTYLEIWNLVFMQFMKDKMGNSTPLPLQCIDTGMGLERVACVMQGKHSNYDVDSIRALITHVEKLSGIKYTGKNFLGESQDEHYATDVAMRVIADHIRSACFLIADGVSPGNEGADYVLRRIMRRAIKHSLALNLEQPFMRDLALLLVELMGEDYPELKSSETLIAELVAREEQQFRKTLRSGMGILESWLEDNKEATTLPGDIAFKLYDTFGFPLDLTQDILLDHKKSVDVDGFEDEMQQQRERSRGGAKAGGSEIAGSMDNIPSTSFVGYEQLESESTLVHIESLKNGKKALIFRETPFYAEMGGQVGDSGIVEITGQELPVLDTIKIGNDYYGHIIQSLPEGAESGDLLGQSARLLVDKQRRERIARHHSATHLLHAALREVLGEHVSQRGSYVDDARLRFDFSHFKALSEDELATINQMVNHQIRENYECISEEMSHSDAVNSGALAFFGDKYGSLVRVVTLGPKSKELCGGTHIGHTGQIGVHTIVSEGSISSGVRRIECVVGQSAEEFLWEQLGRLNELSKMVKGNSGNVIEKVQGIVESQKGYKSEVKRLQGKLALEYSREITSHLGDGGHLHRSYAGLGRDILQQIADYALGNHVPDNVLLSLYDEEQKMMVLKSKKGGANCKNIVNELRKQYEIKGGGSPTAATLVGVNPSMLSGIVESLEEQSRG